MQGEYPASEAPAPYWKCAVAAIPELVIAAQFLVVALTRKPFLGADREWLTRLMQAEFLVIHSTAFLGLLALWKPADAGGRRWRAGLFWGLFSLYVLLAIKHGAALLLIFVSLTFVTYLGLFLNWRSPSALVQLGARWLAGFLLFALAVGVFSTPKDVGRWVGNSSVLHAGALYFLVLAAVELSGFYLRYIPPRAQAIIEALRKANRKRAR